jgi:hypothetical protein
METGIVGNNDKILALGNLAPEDYEVVLRLAKSRFRLYQVGKRHRASDPYEVWIEGNVTVEAIKELLMHNCDYPGSIRVREVA